MSKRSSSQIEDVETNSRPEKKQKVDLWEQVQHYFDRNTEAVGDHVIWTGYVPKFSKFPILNFSVGKKHSAHRWYYYLKHKSHDQPENTRLESICDEKMCLSHYYARNLDVKSFEEMTEDDCIILASFIKKHCQEMTTPPSNSELKSNCQIWTGTKNNGGYGTMKLFGKTVVASRVSLQFKLRQDLTNDITCRHKCANTLCVNMDHLEPGSQSQNMKDRVRDGTNQQGETHAMAKTTDEVVRKIFWSRQGYKKTVQERADEFKVSKRMVRSIDEGATWAHLFTDEDRKKVMMGKKIGKRLTEDQIKSIQECKTKGLNISGCARELKISEAQVSRIYKGKLYAERPKKLDRSSKTLTFTEEEARQKLEKIKENCEIFIDEKKETHWLWKKRVDKAGYATSGFKNRTYFTHRLVYMLVNGINHLEKSQIIRHKCKGYKNCVCPEHLEIGTASDNSKDKIRDGTQEFGENHHSAKITEDLARKIKKSLGQGNKQERADRFGVSYSIVSHIDSGNSWKFI